jgi:hypothetical protein
MVEMRSKSYMLRTGKKLDVTGGGVRTVRRTGSGEGSRGGQRGAVRSASAEPWMSSGWRDSYGSRGKKQGGGGSFKGGEGEGGWESWVEDSDGVGGSELYLNYVRTRANQR